MFRNCPRSSIDDRERRVQTLVDKPRRALSFGTLRSIGSEDEEKHASFAACCTPPAAAPPNAGTFVTNTRQTLRLVVATSAALLSCGVMRRYKRNRAAAARLRRRRAPATPRASATTRRRDRWRLRLHYRQCLAPAAAPIHFPLVTGPAQVQHPIGAARNRSNAGRARPDLRQRLVPHRDRTSSPDRLRGVAGQLPRRWA